VCHLRKKTKVEREEFWLSFFLVKAEAIGTYLQSTDQKMKQRKEKIEKREKENKTSQNLWSYSNLLFLGFFTNVQIMNKRKQRRRDTKEEEN